MEEERLDVVNPTASRSGVADMTYRHAALKSGEVGLVKNFSHKAFPLDSLEVTFIITGYDTASFLSPVLQGVKTVIHQIRGILDSVDAEHSTFFVDLAVKTIHIRQI